jgi:hypothetical protein
MTLWCRLWILDGDGTVTSAHRLEGAGAPDLGAVEEVARQALQATRAGGRLVLVEVAPELRALIELAALPVQMEG